MRLNVPLFFMICAGCAARVPPPAPEPTAMPLEEMVRDESDPRRAASMESVEMGRKELAQGRLERSAQYFSRAIEIDAADPFAYFFLAVARMRANRSGEALSLFRRAADLFARFPSWRAEALAYRGEILERLARHEEARRAYEEAVGVDSGNVRGSEGLKRLP